MVVNYELPNVPEDYVHRIGRTARAGATGRAVSLVAPDEASLLRDIEKTMRQSVPFIELPKFVIPAAGTEATQASNFRPAEHRPKQNQAQGAGNRSGFIPDRRARSGGRGSGPRRGAAGGRARST